ncbi:ArnT family glycosyltransferase [Spirosoma fluviale]|uniref:4-amino-4-deoxy-L-arabinose transferase n=1 Tax=Spirosoma fluviale TaxID=1597977 RepID=A0A286G146_9BACT|nr:glycosyltransferase family 39 protein [Spirosoma fluviale]SOD89223.1 4-amino-4-deoxy-L-arabinose transferase [Spirosoma fluviale]
MTDNYPSFDDRWFYAFVAVGVFLNATGLFPPIMELDGALYACIAKQMAQTGDFVNLYAVGSDWLDKPHFPFWVIAVSYKLFGINTFGYKFPALLFFLGSVVYTYKFARLTYPKIVAQLAALVLLTAFHGVLSNSDVRAEPFLMPLIIGAVYHFYRVFLGSNYGVRKDWLHLVIGSLLTGCALMTKGVFVLIPIGGGLVLHWLLTGHWRELLKLRWYVAVALSFAFTLPEIYCLYQQFDAHPEKVVFGEKGVSGVRFFFWDSQFGRFFNTGPIKGEGDKFFFVHTLLWAFLPWSLPLYIGIGKMIRDLFKRQNNPSPATSPEYVSLGSSLLTFALFSFSGFQLPHYMNIVFPFFAVITAQFLVGLTPKNLRRWTVGQTAIGVAIAGLSIALLVFVQPENLVGSVVLVIIMTLATYTLFRQNTLLSLSGRMVGAMLVLGGTLNLFLYPTFLRYQAGMATAQYVNNDPKLAKRPTILYEPGTGVGGGSFWTYEFYVKSPTTYARSDSSLKARLQAGSQQVFTTGEYADSLELRGFQVKHLAVFPYYHVSQLTYEFLNPATRSQTLTPYVLAEVGAKK